MQPVMRLPSDGVSLTSLERKVLRVVLEICRTMQGIWKDNRRSYEIREYVEQTYTDVNLSIGVVADCFGMGQGYASLSCSAS